MSEMVISLRKISNVCGKKGCGLMARGVGNGIGLERLGVGDKWGWLIGECGEFTVKDLSIMVEDKTLHADSGAQEAIWNRVDGGSDHLIRLGSSLVAGTQSMDDACSERKTVVWTAYRDDPPVSPNATLELTHKGELVLVSEQSGVNKTIAANMSSALMNDDGNFILYNDSMDVVWQSFHYPTDSILRGQSLLGGSELVSSVSKTNLSSGRFCIKMQMDGNLVMYPINTVEEHRTSYWATNTSEHGMNASKNYLYLSDAGLQLIDGNISDVISFLYDGPATVATLGDDGIFRVYSYNQINSTYSLAWRKPDYPCDVTNFCGCNSYCTTNDDQPYCVCLPGSDLIDPDRIYSGCERNYTKASCDSGKENATYYNMIIKEQLVWDDDPYYRAMTNNKGDCSKWCLEDCDCDASLLKDGYCSKHKFPLWYVEKSCEATIFTSFIKTGNISLLNVTANEGSSSKKRWVVILVISIGFSIYSCMFLSLSGIFIFKYRLLKYKRIFESKTLGLAEDVILWSYTYNELKRATNGFKQELGRGSFGRVYKGSFYKGKKTIAVKRLEKVVDEGEKEFRAEMQVIGKTHHSPILYCDIKPQNILMDDFWNAKISDFGLAKLLNPDQTKTFTMVRGTRGYLAPEWQKNNPISVKVDIFSYGIVWVYKCFERGQLNLLADHEEAEKESLERLVKVGLWCTQDEPALRPSMKCVLLMLEGITDIATPPCPTPSCWKLEVENGRVGWVE
ncbi:G-type lectin S-receptor-like serine/threonine-protein kinase LECRK3 [Tanacetum coccineum]